MTKRKKIGISSKCLDGKHILMMDFDIPEGGKVKYAFSDKYNKQILLSQLILQGSKTSFLHDLPDIYVFETKHGYHLVCMAKMSLDAVLMLYDEFKGLADKHHVRIGGSVCKRFILRVGDEIKPETVIRGYNERQYQTSKAHQDFFSHFYDMKIRDQNPDESQVVVFELWQ